MSNNATLVWRDQENTEMREVAFKLDKDTILRHDALFSWFGNEPLCADHDIDIPTSELHGYLMKAEEEAHLMTHDKENPIPSITTMLRRTAKLHGFILDRCSDMEDVFNYESGTLLFRGYNLGETGYVNIIEEFVKQMNQMDNTIDEFVGSNFPARDAITFTRAKSDELFFVTINGVLDSYPKWLIEAYALHLEFIKVPAFRGNFKRFVFTYIDKEIDQGNFDLKLALRFIARMGRLNTKVYLVS